MVAQMRNIIVKSAPTLQLGDIISKNTRPGCTRYNYVKERAMALGKKQNIYIVKWIYLVV